MSAEPLLLEDLEAANRSSVTPPPTIRGKRSVIKTTCAGLLLLTLLLGATLVYETASFGAPSRDVQIVNGSAVEPNTHALFPVERARTALGVARIIGLFLETSVYAHVTIKLFTIALYLDREGARASRALAQYRKSGASNSIEDPQAFQAFTDLLANGGAGSVTMEYVMLFSMPGTVMQDRWGDALVECWMEKYKLPKQQAEGEELLGCFLGWFGGRPMKSGERYLWEYDVKTGAMRMQRNGQYVGRACTHDKFGPAFVSGVLDHNANNVVDLLPTLWREEWDVVK